LSNKLAINYFEITIGMIRFYSTEDLSNFILFKIFLSSIRPTLVGSCYHESVVELYFQYRISSVPFELYNT